MEKKFYTDNYERYLKEQADDFRMIPSKRIWHSLYNGMHPGRKWPSFLMFFILTTGVLYVGKENTSMPNNNSNNDQVTYSNSKTSKKSNKKNKQNDIAFSELLNDGYFYSNDVVLNDYDISYTTPTVPMQSVEPIKIDDNALGNKPQKAKKSGTESVITPIFDETVFEKNNAESKSLTAKVVKTDEKEVKQKTEKKKTLSTDNKRESASLNNKKSRKEATTIEFYATPSIGFRNLNIDNAFDRNNFVSTANPTSQQGTNTNDPLLKHKPIFNLEAGFNFAFAATKKVNLKAGVQLNVTGYGINGRYLNHPAPTLLAEINPNTGSIEYNRASANVVNDINSEEKIKNTTYQVSLPVGAYYKVLAKNKFDLFVGASVQPTFVFGGNPNVISADKQYYISNPTLLRRWNMNTAAEAYISYKFGDLNLLAGPQVRYQLFSTYKSNISVSERLYNLGFKIGLSKSF